ncbi:hypothetical protein DFH11DRAFT_1822460 [Phellopilus nigrolimitatus]|nr:hypothetical protein DFH11DRAFT_1822460 [Phellopilus nigrolimitatus]
MAEYDVYSEQLFSLRNGHALYEPDPAGQDYDKVRIGDVGYVHYGVFHRLFNICYDAHDPINKLGVPEYFEPIHPDDRKEYNRTPLPPGVMSSSSVRRIGGKIGASGPAAVEQSRVPFRRRTFTIATSLCSILCSSSPVRLDREWEMEAFDESARGASVSFEVGQAPFGSGNFKLWEEWTSNVHVPHRCGPIPTLPPASRESLLITGGLTVFRTS